MGWAWKSAVLGSEYTDSSPFTDEMGWLREAGADTVNEEVADSGGSDFGSWLTFS